MNTVAVEIIERRPSTISAEEADRIAIERIRHYCDLQGATHIDAQGNLCREEEVRAGGHSSWATTVIREATPLDHAVFTVLHKLAAEKQQHASNVERNLAA